MSILSQSLPPLCALLSYDSNMDDSRDNKKNRFSNTMVFMEEYLNNVLNDELPFHNEEKNKLTYEVWPQFSSDSFKPSCYTRFSSIYPVTFETLFSCSWMCMCTCTKEKKLLPWVRLELTTFRLRD